MAGNLLVYIGPWYDRHFPITTTLTSRPKRL
jgi:hypothetical protein